MISDDRYNGFEMVDYRGDVERLIADRFDGLPG